MAIDMGRRRCGIAVTDPLRIVANPLTTVATAELCEWVQRYIASEGLDGVVVGRPTDMQGRPSDSTRYIEPVVGRLRKLIAPVPVTYADERFTTVLARRAMIDGGMKASDRRAKRDIDAISASIILNDYITFNQ
ncbi:MAG: Holliday junction resolvase RuvX [Terasakiella sp.]|nr:Holliday junction resolvase RuvX [Terasakiella sp.]